VSLWFASHCIRQQKVSSCLLREQRLHEFTKSAAELESGLDVWLYFLRNAEKIDAEALPPVLDRPLVHRALEELKVLSQTDQERERYEARRKWQLDYNTGMKVARMEGREEGRQEGEQIGRAQGEQIGRAQGEQIGRAQGEQIGRAQGEQIGRVHAFERLLGRPETPTEQLAALSLEELTRRADELQALLQR
jgi:hypothetical protein